jgi:tRNA nucleotidyltransferase (CCA-adding enzyme)
MSQITKGAGALRAHIQGQLAPTQRAALEGLGDAVAAAGGRALLLGGCVRDAVLGRSLRDLDVEVFGIPPGRLRALVQARFRADVVGRHFPVLRLHGLSIDVSLPRRRAPAGSGAPDFDADADPEVTPAEAASRRDFTLNAIGLDPRNGELVDPLRGLADLAAGRLRHASERFDEDPLRVLRAMQLVARFELEVAAATRERCRALSPSGLARERVFGEWRRLLLEGVRPSLGLHFLREVGWLRHFPEIDALVGCPQDPVWHPEGDVFVHTGHCLDAFARERSGDARDDLVVGLAVLAHDFGKPATTRSEAGRVTSKGHEALGASLCEAFLARLCDESDLIGEVACLVAAHLAPAHLHRDGAGDAAIRRLARRVGRIDRLVRVAAADHAGRPPLAEPFAAGAWLLARARALEVVKAAPRPLVRGRHLLALGRAPGPAFGPLLRACYDAQLAGAFASEEDGVAFLRRLLGGEAPASPVSRAKPE